MDHGKLTTFPRPAEAVELHLPIDFFFRSLAAERGNRAIGVILSGTASDGTSGLSAIKDENGITFVQDPKTAKFPGMPRSALDAGVVDYSLSPSDLAQELVRLSRHPYVVAAEVGSRTDEKLLDKIFVLIRNAVGVDYSEYKSPTFERRLEPFSRRERTGLGRRRSGQCAETLRPQLARHANPRRRRRSRDA